MSYQKKYTAPANVPAQQAQGADLISEINRQIPELKKALPKAYSAERMARILITEVKKTPKLMQSDKASFFGALMQCAQLGLEPGSALGHAWLIPRNRKGGGVETQLMIGYQGMIDLAERDGRVTLVGRAVYENEIFDTDYGTEERIIHKPTIGKGARGDLVAVYALAKYKDGRKKFLVLGLDEIEAARARSASPKNGPWVTDFEAMAVKTAIRRLFKQLPKSPEAGRVIELDEQAEMGKSQRLSDFNPIEAIAAPASEEEEESPVLGQLMTLAHDFETEFEKTPQEISKLFSDATRKPIPMMDVDDLEMLHGIFNNLKAGVVTWEELLENVRGE